MAQVEVLPDVPDEEEKKNSKPMQLFPGRVEIDPIRSIEPLQWDVLHGHAFASPREMFYDEKNNPRQDEIDRYKKWLDGFGNSLHCIRCRTHFFSYLRANPVDFNDVFAWTVKYHNVVNKLSKKKDQEIPVMYARTKWTLRLAKNGDEIDTLRKRFAKYKIVTFPVDMTLSEAYIKIEELEANPPPSEQGESTTETTNEEENESSTESSQISATLGIVVVLTVLVLGALGFYMYRRYQRKKLDNESRQIEEDIEEDDEQVHYN